MPREWTRAALDKLCGLCGELIEKGEPMLELTIAGISNPKPRCKVCAGPAPPNLPPLVEHMPAFTPMVHIVTGPDALPLDFKHAQAGEREPGEEG